MLYMNSQAEGKVTPCPIQKTGCGAAARGGNLMASPATNSKCQVSLMMERQEHDPIPSHSIIFLCQFAMHV